MTQNKPNVNTTLQKKRKFFGPVRIEKSKLLPASLAIRPSHLPHPMIVNELFEVRPEPPMHLPL